MEQPDKLAGVWLDQHEAHIISNHDGRIVNALEIKGHVKSDVHLGNHGSEHAANNARTNARYKFFNEILGHLTNTQKLHLIGTGTAQEQFINYVADMPQWKKMIVTEEATDKLDASQSLHKISAYFQQQL